LTREHAICEVCASNTNALEASGWDFEYATSREEFQIVHCLKCNLLYLADRPTIENTHLIYPQNYYSYDESSSQNRLIKKIREKLEYNKVRIFIRLLGNETRWVLDIGCGDGRLLNTFTIHCPSTWNLTGIEINENAAKKAKTKGYEVLTGDFEFKELEWNKKFDLILMHQVLEHTRSPRQVVQKVSKLLKPGGLFSIETPDTKSWDRKLFGKKYWGGYHIPRHFYLFDKENISHLLNEEGFEIISCKSMLSPVFWILSIHNYLIDHQKYRLARFFHYQNPLLLIITSIIDLIQTIFFSQSSNMQIIAKRKYDSK